MTKYNRARQILTFLETTDTKGEIKIRHNGILYTIDDDEITVPALSPVPKAMPVVTKTQPTPKSTPVAPLVWESLSSIKFGKDGSTGRGGKSWNEIVVPKLKSLGFTTVQQLQEVTREELRVTKGIGNIADIISDAMKRAGSPLRI